MQIDGVSRHSKWRALNELERGGMIVVERRYRRSPLALIDRAVLRNWLDRLGLG